MPPIDDWFGVIIFLGIAVLGYVIVSWFLGVLARNRHASERPRLPADPGFEPEPDPEPEPGPEPAGRRCRNPKCRHRNASTARYCASCGEPLN